MIKAPEQIDRLYIGTVRNMFNALGVTDNHTIAHEIIAMGEEKKAEYATMAAGCLEVLITYLLFVENFHDMNEGVAPGTTIH